MHLKVITPPIEEPVTIDSLKEYLHIDHDDEPTTFNRISKAARLSAEKFTRRSLVTKTYELTLQTICDQIKLPNPPLVNVEQITVKDKDGNVTEITDYYVRESEPAVVYVREWPNVELYPVDAVKVQYTAGYDQLPEDIEQALHLLVNHFYENREVVIVGTSVVKLPFSVESLLYPYKAGWF